MNQLIKSNENKKIKEYVPKLIDTFIDGFKNITDDSEKSKIIITGVKTIGAMAITFIVCKSGIEFGKLKIGVNSI